MNDFDKHVSMSTQGNCTTIRIKAEKHSGINIVNTQGKAIIINNWKIQTTGKVDSINQINGDSVIIITGDSNPQISRNQV